MKRTQVFFRSIFLAAIACAVSVPAAFAADSSAEKQQKLIAVLKSDAPSGEKAIACKQLAIYGNKEAVPALAPLLENKDLISWARIALEAIPGPEADAALRDALPKLQGNLLIGAINSIGVRRDAKAVDALARKLGENDVQVVAAAAVALGKIGGTQAATVLGQTLANAREAILPSIAEGSILCAERYLADGKFAESAAFYDAVRNKAGLSKQRKLEATRGAILARQTAGLPLLMEQLRSADRAAFGMGLRTARELKGREITEAIGAEMDKVEAERQEMLLLALADRKDEAVFPKLLQAAGKSAKGTRVAALGLLDRFGDVSAVPVLLSAAVETDADVARPAQATLTRMEGAAVDAALLSRLPQATGKTKQVIIELAALRRINGALPAVVSSAGDADAGVRKAAFSTLSTLGSEQHVDGLVKVLAKTKNADDREGIEGALMAICGRNGAKCLPPVLPLAKNEDSELRVLGLRVLATIGGPEALGAVTAAVQDADETVQDEAVGIMATWPNNWPEDATVSEPLLNLVKTGRKPAHKIQGARGYLLQIQENKKLSTGDKLAAMDRLLPLLKLPQEKRLAIATLSSIPTQKTLELLGSFAEDAALTEEACLALVNVATAKTLEGATKESRQKALQTVMEKSKNDSTREKAGVALKKI